MNREEAEGLQKQWGDKPCGHPDLISERDASGPTDAWRCTECGAVVDYDDWRKSLQ